MLVFTVSPAIIGFELREQGSGAHGGVRCVRKLGRPQGHGGGCDVKCESEQGVTAVASSKTVPQGECVTSRSMG